MANETARAQSSTSSRCGNRCALATSACKPRRSPRITIGGIAVAVSLAACSPTPTSQSQWTTKGAASSPFSATLYEDTYNSGDSTLYRLRFEKREDRVGGGWFVMKNLDGDEPHPRRPALIWSTPKDLRVVVYTDHIEGRVVQTFTNAAGTDGALTLDYEPSH